MKTANPSEEEPSGDESRTNENAVSTASGSHPQGHKTFRQTVVICAIIFVVALGCRLLSWQDNRFEARKVQSAVTEGYKHTGRLLREGGIRSFFSGDSPLSDPNHLGHPPGYSILIAVVFSLFGESDAALQIVQILADATAAVVVLLIALALVNRTAATIAGLLVALAPQFTYNSVLLLPDTLAVLPILLSAYFFIRAWKRPGIANFAIAGALVGLSCWLRANALLLAPFMAAVIPLLFERGRRMRYMLALVGGAVLVVVPLTVRNYIVYDYFIPVSLGAGQTFLEGIADYDADGSLGIPNTDMGIMKWESEIYQRPDYYGMLFNPDGVKRERQRLAQGFHIIRAHPFWFIGVMARRGAAMLRLERVRIVSPDPPVTHSIAAGDAGPPASSAWPGATLADAIESHVTIRSVLDGQMLGGLGNEPRKELTLTPISIDAQTEYVFSVPIRIEQGRAKLSVVGVGNEYEYASTIIETQDWKTASEQPMNYIEIAFVTGSADQVRLVFTNAGATGTIPVLEIGVVALYPLGPTSFTWTRGPRAVIRVVQKLFITAVMLPLAIAGFFLMYRDRNRSALVILLVVPAYYVCVQSALHTEYRYVLAIHYFLFVLVAVALSYAGSFLWSKLSKLRLLRRFIPARS